MAEGRKPEQVLNELIMSYRNTPHAATGEKPSKLLFNRDISTKLPNYTTRPRHKHNKEAERNDKIAKERQKEYYDKRKRVTNVKINVGDKVYRRELAPTGLRPPWEPRPYTVVKIRGKEITAERDGRRSTRDKQDWKLWKERKRQDQDTEERGKKPGRNQK